jgi:hypothetical protein
VRLLKRLVTGGSDANAHLTAAVAAVLIVLLTVEGATLLNLRTLLTVHAFVGILLIPVVALKLGSTGWRMLRYYRRADEYVRRGPPHIALRVIVAPLVVVSTVFLFGTGVALLAVDQVGGTLVNLHKASFVVWLGTTGVHVLAHVLRLPLLLRVRVPGAALRYGVLGASLLAGAVIAVGTLPAADRLQDQATQYVGVDRG